MRLFEKYSKPQIFTHRIRIHYNKKFAVSIQNVWGSPIKVDKLLNDNLFLNTWVVTCWIVCWQNNLRFRFSVLYESPVDEYIGDLQYLSCFSSSIAESYRPQLHESLSIPQPKWDMYEYIVFYVTPYGLLLPSFFWVVVVHVSHWKHNAQLGLLHTKDLCCSCVKCCKQQYKPKVNGLS